MKFNTARLAAVCLLALAPAFALAGEADVLNATATAESGGSYRISATIRHDDTGWDHYADAFDILAPDGALLGKRILHHPHENEQPFTRSLSNVQVPSGATYVTVRAHDKVHGFGGKEFRLSLR